MIIVCCFEHFVWLTCTLGLGVSKMIFSSCGGARTPLQILFILFCDFVDFLFVLDEEQDLLETMLKHA
jgi:hypothetical protein